MDFHLVQEPLDGLLGGKPYGVRAKTEAKHDGLVAIYYNASRYAAEQIDRLFGQLRTLAAAAVSSPHVCVGERVQGG